MIPVIPVVVGALLTKALSKQKVSAKRRAPKYSKYDKWFIAKTYQSGMTYTEFTEIAKRLGIPVAPKGTYDMQGGYLKHKTPEEIAETASASLTKTRR